MVTDAGKRWVSPPFFPELRKLIQPSLGPLAWFTGPAAWITALGSFACDPERVLFLIFLIFPTGLAHAFPVTLA